MRRSRSSLPSIWSETSTKHHLTFTRKSPLDCHNTLHMREDSYSCEYPNCNKSFIQLAQLALHTRTHITYQNRFGSNSAQFGLDPSQPQDVSTVRQSEKFALSNRAYFATLNPSGRMTSTNSSSIILQKCQQCISRQVSPTNI